MTNLIPVDRDPFMGAASAAPNSVPADQSPFAAGRPATLVPVDYDPFADGPGTPARLVPVDYNPFEDNPGAASRLVPVDHDPFADVAAAASIAGPSPQQPNLQPSLAGNSFRNFSSPPSPGRFASLSLPSSVFSPPTQGGLGSAPYSPSDNLTPPVWPIRPPILPDVTRRYSQLENPPPPSPAFDPSMSLLGLIPQTWPENMSLPARASGMPASPTAAPGDAMPSPPPPGTWIGPQPAFTGASGASGLDGLGAGPSGAGNSARIQLVQQGPPRRGMNPEDFFDLLAPLRVDLYNAARRDLEQIQPQNYRLSVPSARTPGSAPTIEEIGELKFAYRIAQQTQPLADIASRIWRLLADPRAQEGRTVAVLKTSKGLYVATSGEKPFTQEQLAAIGQTGAIALRPAGRNVHAEIAALAQSEGEPQFIATSREFCPLGCPKALEARGAFITSPTTAVFPWNIPSVASPSPLR